MSDDVSLELLFGILAILIVCSAFFSGTETALMSLNRYRLRHKARSGHRGARLAESLLRRPDRIIGLILLGNNLVNNLAAALVAIIALRVSGEAAVAIGALLLTVVVLIFAEVTPKTLAALHPERLALPAAYLYYPLLKVLYPFIWLLNAISNGILRLFGVSPDDADGHSLSHEELRTVVMEAGALISRRYRRMLVSILDLEKVTVDDIMVPRVDVVGIDLDDDLVSIHNQLKTTQHTLLPVYTDELDNISGILHVKRILADLTRGRLDKEALVRLSRDAYFVPEGTSLNVQLVNFQRARERIALVVDEYGDIQGLVTLEDILEEIVGEFTSDPATMHTGVHPEGNGTYVVDGSTNVRALNRMMQWDLPVDGPKTLNGLILEYLETIPEPGTGLKLRGYPIEILQTSDNAVKTVRVHPELATKSKVEHSAQS